MTSDSAPNADPNVATDASAEPDRSPTWNASHWVGKEILDKDGHRIGKLRDVYVDVETDEPLFGTVKEPGFFERHLTFVPLQGATVGPDELRVTCSRDVVKAAPNMDLQGQEMSQKDESALYHHFEMNYSPIENVSGRRLARR